MLNYIYHLVTTHTYITYNITLLLAGGLFGSSAASTSGGTLAVKFQAIDGSDTVVKGGISHPIKTKHYCITAMKQFESKSIEVLTGG